jgi:hypothetical protein
MSENVIDLAAIKHRLGKPSVPIEEAAKLCNLSTRTIRRHLHKFEVRRDRRNHIFISKRSIQHFLEYDRYQPSTRYDARKTEGNREFGGLR